MKIGETISTTVGKLELDEYVPYEPSCYHYDPGFWANRPGEIAEDDPRFYVSEEGIVYTNSEQWPDVYDVAIGEIKVCAACDGDPEAHGLHVCGKEPFE